MSIKVINGALDEYEGAIILRGVIDPSSFHLLQVGDYQREVLPHAKISELMAAFEKGSVPDIELGMRGGDFNTREENYFLKNDTYIIDSLQRVTAAIQQTKKGGDRVPRLGAMIHFKTTEEWERESFRILNQERTKLSPNILLRNLRETHPVVEMIHVMSTQDKGFVLCGRVSWSQRQQRQELITALTFMKTIDVLHAHFGPGRSSRLDEVARGAQAIMDAVGRNTFRDNIRTFFDLIDSCWGVKAIAFREGAVYLRSGFLLVLADVLGRHQNFWREKRLFIEKDVMRKIALFPVSDPHVSNLASSGGQARHLLFDLLVKHINSGKTTRRLIPFDFHEREVAVAPAIAIPADAATA